MSSGILIVGAGGQLGKELSGRFPDAIAADTDTLDISDYKSVSSFDWSGIKVILNAAAFTQVDGAETPEGRRAAWKVNATAVGYLAEVANKHDITLVHISTDYVFDGTVTSHTESEELSPLSVYGSSKAAGDIAASLVSKSYILRTSWVIGDGKNFVRTMIELAKKGVNPTVVADQVGRLTFTATIADAVEYLLSHKVPYGIYNITNEGEPISWADITRAIYKEAGLSNDVTDTTTAEYYAGKEGVAPRPLQSTLDLSKIKSLGFIPRTWQEDLKLYVKKELGK